MKQIFYLCPGWIQESRFWFFDKK